MQNSFLKYVNVKSAISPIIATLNPVTGPEEKQRNERNNTKQKHILLSRDVLLDKLPFLPRAMSSAARQSVYSLSASAKQVSLCFCGLWM